MRAPFFPNGSLARYADSFAINHQGVEMRETEPWTAMLKLAGMRRGRSAAYFMWKDDEGREFPMFMKDMGDLLTLGAVVHGAALERWTVQKRGDNYGIRMVAQ